MNESSFCNVHQMVDPQGIANWSVTHVDWSEGKWHPKAYRAQDITFELLKNISVCFLTYCYRLYKTSIRINTLYLNWLNLQSIDESVHVTSEEKVPTSYHIFFKIYILFAHKMCRHCFEF